MNRNGLRTLLLLVFLIGISVLLPACMRSQSKGVVSEQFIAPTLVATIFRTPTVDPFMTTLNPQADCTNSLTFLDDLTIPDGSIIEPEQSFVKQWQVQNSGTCDWTKQYSARNISGFSMGADAKQKLPELAAGEIGVLEITFTAPPDYGGYYSQWQAHDARGKAFGDDIFVDIVVSQKY